ncbi:DUF1523 domain-containing protein [Candidatus Pacearchaeota archaeon]|nr:DUF1523 domain-containing protein [Candidatus Pacearchaeota archaeon]
MSKLKNILAGATIAGGLALAVATFNLPHLCRETVTATVKDKEVKRYKDKDKYLIFTDKGVFEDTDSWVELKFNSSDLYGKLERGKSYNLGVYGWRIPFLSKYRNITKIKEKK